MKKIIVVLALIALPWIAQAATKEELAKEVVKLTDVRKMTDQVVVQVQQMQSAQIKTLDLPKERQPEAVEFQNKIRKKVTDSINWEKMESEYVGFLVNVYTEDELKAILDFYKLPVGQSILNKEPVMMGKIMTMMQTRIQTVLPEVQKMTRDFIESARKIK